MHVIFFGSAQLRSTLATLATLAERGHDVYHINLAEDPSENYIRRIYVEVRQGLPIPIKQINMSYNKQKSIIARKIKPATISTSALMQLREISADIIISRLESWPLAYSISRRLDVPLVFYSTNIRGLLLFYYLRLHHKYSEILYAPLSVMYNLAISYLSDLTIVTNKKAEKILKSFGVRSTFTLHPPYARIYLLPKQTNLNLSRPYVLAIITLGRPWNVDVDIRAFETVIAIARNTPNITFIVVGTSMSDLTKFNRFPTLPKNIMLVGRIVDDNLLSILYMEATCVLCPFKWSALSNRLLEAFFYGRPIIVTKTIADYYGGLVNGKHCLIEEDFSKWLSKIYEILNDNLLKERLAAGALSYYNTIFSPERYSIILEQILNNLAKD